MKIVFLTRRFYPDIGGVEKHVYTLSKYLQKQKHTITVISEEQQNSSSKQSSQKSAKSLGEIHGVTSLKIPIRTTEKNKKWVIWKWLLTHKDIITRADVVHCHDVFFWYLPFRLLYPNKKVYITFHGYESYPITRKAIIVRKISELLSHGNICIGDFIKRWYGTNPNFVSYGAVEKPKEKNTEVKDLSAVFIGRLDGQTGIDEYTKAFTLLQKEFPRFSLQVIGNGSFEKKLPKSVIHMGFQVDAEKYFSEGRYAFVSRYLSILEAMIRKRLVIAVYDNPIKEDYLSLSPMSRFMVIAKSPVEIVEAVKFYNSHPEIEKEYIEKAYDWASKQTWENMVSIYLKLWKN